MLSTISRSAKVFMSIDQSSSNAPAQANNQILVLKIMWFFYVNFMFFFFPNNCHDHHGKMAPTF